MMTRDELLQLDEAALLKLCRFDSFRGVGPGGQKRNKTESAARVTHVESGLAGFDDTSRSQHINKHNAIQKLRLEMALHLRETPKSWQGSIPSIHNDAFVRWLGNALDICQEKEYKVSDVAAVLGLSTSRLVKTFQECPAAWQFLNAERVKCGLAPLKVNK